MAVKKKRIGYKFNYISEFDKIWKSILNFTQNSWVWYFTLINYVFYPCQHGSGEVSLSHPTITLECAFRRKGGDYISYRSCLSFKNSVNTCLHTTLVERNLFVYIFFYENSKDLDKFETIYIFFSLYVKS